MMNSCGTFNAEYCPLHHSDFMSFDNLETKYSVNKDIHVEYTLRGHVQQASTRDWLGIFPRGWTNIQQYLTFEYALVAPRAAASSNRTIIFPHVFHQEASTSTEYQLVYVSREIQVLATSSYFRFIRDEKTDAINDVFRFPSGVRKTSMPEKREINYDGFAGSGWAPPHTVLSDQSLLSLHPSKTIPANPRLRGTCRTCGRLGDNYACGLAAGRVRFLATHNASLAERVVQLERDLTFAEGTKCSLAERLHAYENFVSEMLRSLATKRIVKITDASGKEIVIQQLPIITESEVKISDESKLDSTRDIRQRESLHPDPETEDSSEKEELPTNDRPLVGEYLSEEKTIPILRDDRDTEKALGGLADRFKNDAYEVEEKETCANVETQTESEIDAKCTGCQNYKNSIAIASCKDEYGECAIVEESKCLEQSAIDQESENKELIDERAWSGDETGKPNVVLEDGSKILQSKPSAIVIRGSNVKFAIIRY